MTAPVTVGETPTVRLGITIPRLSRPPAAALEAARDLCARLGISVVDVTMDMLEAVLGAPVPTVPLAPPPADGMAFGLLELEEDVLRDSYELAKQTFGAQLRAWRLTASLAPLADMKRAWQAAGIAVDVVTVPDLPAWSEAEVDYACQAARLVGARILSTSVPIAGPHRLAPFAHRHGLVLSFTDEAMTGAPELVRLLESHHQITASVDVGSWTAGSHGSPVTFLARHATRISHVRLRDTKSDGAAVTFGGGEAPIRETLRAMRDNRWDFPAVIAIDQAVDDENWHENVTRALAHCRRSLE